MAHVSAEKKKVVAEFKQLISQYPIVGIVNMENLPTAPLQIMRGALRNDGVVLRMTKKRVIKIILEEANKTKPGIGDLAKHLTGMPALILAKENPFKLYKKLQSKKSPAAAKGGQLSPRDIVVSAGPTPFAPGPVIGELGSFKIKAGIDQGKVIIKEDCTVVKKGEVITGPLAALLTRLSIQPMEIGLDLVVVFENGAIFGKDVLAVDEKQYIANIVTAHQHAFNLAVDCAIFTDATTEFLLSKAFNDAKALAIEQAIVSKDVIDELLARASNQAASVEQLTKQ